MKYLMKKNYEKIKYGGVSIRLVTLTEKWCVLTEWMLMSDCVTKENMNTNDNVCVCVCMC